MSFELTQIPRRKTSWGGEGGPLVIPPGQVHQPGQKRCETCGRMVKADRKRPRKGSCKCFYYKRTTTFIDVLQDEYPLKQWGNRNVAWGMSQRPDLQLAASACRPDSHELHTIDDKRELNRIAQDASEYAGSHFKATIGTSEHKLTHMLDRGEQLGVVPARWVKDLEAYQKWRDESGVEWVSVEAFRVFDQWMDKDCDHKAIRYGGTCQCVGIAGTVDRIGWYKGRLRVFDIKTGSLFNEMGHAMQLCMYARMVPYLFPGDQRTEDVDQVDLSVGYIIALPEGKGTCDIIPMDLEKGWRASQKAKLVWEERDEKQWVIERDLRLEMLDMAQRAGSLHECRVLWHNWKNDGLLDAQTKLLINTRAKELKAQVLDAMVESARTECADNVKNATGMSDPSVLFDYVVHCICMSHRDAPQTAPTMTLLMCAAAITRLARMPLQENPLEELEKGISRRDDH